MTEGTHRNRLRRKLRLSTTENVSTYTATDPEDETMSRDLKWSLSGHDADLFCIGNGDGDSLHPQMACSRFKASPDYEDPRDAGRNNRYEVTIIATDSAGNTDFAGRDSDGHQRRTIRAR